MSETPQFYMEVFCLTHMEKQSGRYNWNGPGFYLKLRQIYESKYDARSREEEAIVNLVKCCIKVDETRIYPKIGTIMTKEGLEQRRRERKRGWKIIDDEIIDS
jgi:hypothetical protein